MTGVRTCGECGREYRYDVELCTFCRVELASREPTRGRVLAVTRVDVPSIGHEDVPYWCTLVQAEDDSMHIVKSDRAIETGERFALSGAPEEDLAVVGVLGTGIMGRGLVELLLARGHEVCWLSRSDEHADRARDRVLERLARTMDEDELDGAAARLAVGADPSFFRRCDLVIEAVVEEAEPKADALARAEAHMRPDALLSTNTSGLSLDELAAGLTRPERFGALHFFNPATRMRLVETSRAMSTSDETAARLEHFARSLGKIPVAVAQRPAFVVNRVLMPLINEAVRALEEGAAPPADIDEAVRLGLNHPMGPLALADLIGLDIVASIMDNLAERTGDEGYAPRPLLRRLVDEGKLGRKTGQGFFRHTPHPGGPG